MLLACWVARLAIVNFVFVSITGGRRRRRRPRCRASTWCSSSKGRRSPCRCLQRRRRNPSPPASPETDEVIRVEQVSKFSWQQRPVGSFQFMFESSIVNLTANYGWTIFGDKLLGVGLILWGIIPGQAIGGRNCNTSPHCIALAGSFQ